MLTNCEICGSSFDIKENLEFLEVIPKVCSTKCFIELLFRYIDVTPVDLSKHIQLDISYNNNKRFRSASEEIFAAMLKHYKIPFEYESVIMRLGNLLYIPDFVLLGNKLFIEVKGLWQNSYYKSTFRKAIKTYPDNFMFVDRDTLGRIARASK